MSFTVDQWNHDRKIMILKFIQHTEKENPLLGKDLSELWKKIHKHIISVSKNMYIDNLNETADKIE